MAQQFNYEVEKRIRDNLNFFLGMPIETNNIVASYYNNDGFPNQLNATDRDAYLRLAYSLSQRFVYYGMEDGLFAG